MNKCFLCGKEFDNVISHEICSKATNNIYTIKYIKINNKKLKLCSDCTKAFLFGACMSKAYSCDFSFEMVGVNPKYYKEDPENGYDK